MRQIAWGASLGLASGVGLVLVMVWFSARRPPRVGARIRPHILGPGPADQPGSLWSFAVAVVLPQYTPSIGTGIRARLARAGSADSPSHYRLEHIAWAALGACAGGLCAVAVDAPAPLGLVLLSAVGAVLGGMAREWRLTRQARLRRHRLEEELPAVTELLAFAISAGESPHGAIARVSNGEGGELAAELAAVVADVRSGIALEAALRAMAERTASAAICRFVDGMLLAIEHGTPLADVMRAQAADARSDARRRLMELAGRKDVAMLIPVVFLILPTVVVVALFPGLQSLRLVAP